MVIPFESEDSERFALPEEQAQQLERILNMNDLIINTVSARVNDQAEALGMALDKIASLERQVVAGKLAAREQAAHVARLERALHESAATVSHLEAALEQFLEMVTPVTRTMGLEAQISAQEERLNWLDQATRELAAIVSQDAWEHVVDILTGGSESSDE